jgi:hypothetical protein
MQTAKSVSRLTKAVSKARSKLSWLTNRFLQSAFMKMWDFNTHSLIVAGSQEQSLIRRCSLKIRGGIVFYLLRKKIYKGLKWQILQLQKRDAQEW